MTEARFDDTRDSDMRILFDTAQECLDHSIINAHDPNEARIIDVVASIEDKNDYVQRVIYHLYLRNKYHYLPYESGYDILVQVMRAVRERQFSNTNRSPNPQQQPKVVISLLDSPEQSVARPVKASSNSDSIDNLSSNPSQPHKSRQFTNANLLEQSDDHYARSKINTLQARNTTIKKNSAFVRFRLLVDNVAAKRVVPFQQELEISKDTVSELRDLSDDLRIKYEDSQKKLLEELGKVTKMELFVANQHQKIAKLKEDQAHKEREIILLKTVRDQKEQQIQEARLDADKQAKEITRLGKEVAGYRISTNRLANITKSLTTEANQLRSCQQGLEETKTRPEGDASDLPL